MTEPAEMLNAELLDIARRAAEAAVRLIQDDRPENLNIATKSSSTDYVTEMDRASERLIRSIIAESRPNDIVVGEEDQPAPMSNGDDHFRGTVATWYVDPIDGTTNYVYDHPGYNVSIAAEMDGRVVAGVVADPTHQRVYSATLGGGAFCNGRRLLIALVPSASEAELLSKALIATGFGYSAERRTRQARVLAELIAQVRDLRRMGAAALDLCSVASGRVDAYYEVGLSIWDLAAGALVATEAGATVGPIRNGPELPDSVLASRPDLFEPLQNLLAATGAGLV